MAKKFVMVVDDHQDIVDTLRMIMDAEGYKTDFANNGQQLLDKLKTVKPDLVLLDVMMPGLTSSQILTKINEMGLKKLKIIFVTVVRFSKEESKFLNEKFNIVDYITKPFDVPDLVKRVKKQLK